MADITDEDQVTGKISRDEIGNVSGTQMQMAHGDDRVDMGAVTDSNRGFLRDNVRVTYLHESGEMNIKKGRFYTDLTIDALDKDNKDASACIVGPAGSNEIVDLKITTDKDGKKTLVATYDMQENYGAGKESHQQQTIADPAIISLVESRIDEIRAHGKNLELPHANLLSFAKEMDRSVRDAQELVKLTVGLTDGGQPNPQTVPDARPSAPGGSLGIK